MFLPTPELSLFHQCPILTRRRFRKPSNDISRKLSKIRGCDSPVRFRKRLFLEDASTSVGSSGWSYDGDVVAEWHRGTLYRSEELGPVCREFNSLSLTCCAIPRVHEKK